MIDNTSDISIQKQGYLGRIILTRPKVLNALSHEMALKIEQALLAWEADSDVRHVLIDAEGDKAFCAGGNVQDLYAQGQNGDYESGIQFWRDEYRLNNLISNYQKPFIALMNGIVMGGGVGISSLGSHRIVTENTGFALPECSIGLVPDVGSTHLLSQAPGHLGEYLALTGIKTNHSDTLYCGFADDYVPAASLPALINELTACDDINIIKKLSEPLNAGPLQLIQNQIDNIFNLPNLEDIIDALSQSNAEWANIALKRIMRSSPIAVKVALHLVRAARETPGIPQALQREFRFVSRAMEHGDFIEGVRAAIIDKDRDPQWAYPTIGDVPEDVMKLMTNTASGGDITFLKDRQPEH